jgi:hypothetical protein
MDELTGPCVVHHGLAGTPAHGLGMVGWGARGGRATVVTRG